ncbi:hypothetical protein C477_05284 [Haloterrigena salina JCM 13891]|uniref:DUF5658 domain-containing protein n=1 Tax=Haloterrigena salina JCM 13891 TaxID=1227488 RepID=M0CIK7_9EURY|nr:hypothetical protein [Haloterrigena salina]ELZ21729.1 hypothetical protein C477_05284 [Haloterrigena salina JCM 13891]
MSVQTSLGKRLDPPDSVGIRFAFLTLWGIDAVAATLFFLVPYASELNPVTVFFYHLFGLPGVLLAAACYAAVVMLIGHVLSDPMDVRFVAIIVGLYVLFAANNLLLLVYREPLPELLGLW